MAKITTKNQVEHGVPDSNNHSEGGPEMRPTEEVCMGRRCGCPDSMMASALAAVYPNSNSTEKRQHTHKKPNLFAISGRK
jgi:hypothetical protein